MKFAGNTTNKFISFVLMISVLMSTFSSFIPTAFADSTASCTESISVNAGDSVEWSASVSGNSGATISWSGSDGLSGNGSSTSITYATGGVKSGTVTVTAVGAETSVSCSDISISTIVTPPTPAPTVTLSANPNPINSGEASTLTWSSTNATSCSSTNFNTGNTTSGSVSTGALTTNQTYSVACVGDGGTGNANVTVTVNTGGGGGGGGGTAPTATLSANPSEVSSGATTALSWSSTNANSCVGSGFSTAGATSGSTTTPALSSDTTFSVTCTGQVSPAATASVTVTIASSTTTPPTGCTENCGGGGGGHSSGGSRRLTISNESVQEIVPGVAFVTWDTNLSATTRVIYGTSHIDSLGDAPNHDYQFSTVELQDLLTSHGMAIAGLEAGTTYYFRPVSAKGSLYAVGDEVELVPAGGTGNGCQYLFDYLKIGVANNPIEVRKLQVFLRDIEGFSEVQVNGVFDQATFDAVSAFQVKYSSDILTPWGYSANTPTGFVYILTKKKINEIYCRLAFPLTAGQESEIAAFRTFLSNLEQEGIPGGGTIAPSETGSTTAPDILDDGAQIGQATSTPVLGIKDNFQNLAAAILAGPLNTRELFECIYFFILTLIGLYILSLLAVRMLWVPELEYTKKVSYRTMSFIIGLAVAIVVALIVGQYCLILPLLVALIVVAGLLFWYTHDKEHVHGIDNVELPEGDIDDEMKNPPIV